MNNILDVITLSDFNGLSTPAFTFLNFLSFSNFFSYSIADVKSSLFGGRLKNLNSKSLRFLIMAFISF